MATGRTRYQKDDNYTEFCEQFATKMRAVPLPTFVRLVSQAGLPTQDARDLCDAFKRLKA
jgi:hypothetical protein